MKLWLSRQHDGSHMLTYLKPIWKGVKGTAYEDFYIEPGEPIGVRHLCQGGVKSLFNVELEIGNSIRVEMLGKIIEPI